MVSAGAVDSVGIDTDDEVVVNEGLKSATGVTGVGDGETGENVGCSSYCASVANGAVDCFIG